MPSLTPQHRSDEVANTAFQDGVLSGALALVPSGACVYLAMRNPRFVRATNWQSRTALVIMPALFAFAISSETKLNRQMQEMAAEAEHSRATAEWALRRRDIKRKRMMEGSQGAAVAGATGAAATTAASSFSLSGSGMEEARGVVDGLSKEEVDQQLTEIYRRGVEDSGVRIIPGDSLGIHHRLSNFLMENPFKTLAAVGIPTVLYIFKGRAEKDHLQLQMKVMHTRVFGQFAVISMLLSLMGFKEYMDRNGKFITEAEAHRKVEEMHLMRDHLMERLEMDRVKMAERDRVLRMAHSKDLERLGRLGEGEDLAHYGVLEEDLRWKDQEEDVLTEEEAHKVVVDVDAVDDKEEEERLAKKSSEKKTNKRKDGDKTNSS